MDDRVFVHYIVPLPALDAERFEASLRDAVMPAVDMGQTRGGRITGQWVYRTSDGNYCWLVRAEMVGAGASWPESQMKEARAQLAEIGVVYDRDEFVPIAGDPGLG